MKRLRNQLLKNYRNSLIFLLFFKFYYSEAQSVTYQTLYTNSTLESKAVNTSLPVGSITGASTVSQGIANYTIPIQIPAGTNNVVPQLSIVYQSQGSDGLLGNGWKLTGFSLISRNLKSFYNDGFVGPANVDANDRFAVDGARLIATLGTYGANNTTYSKEIEDFSKTTSFGISGTGPTYFKVETKEGVVLEYGNTSDSRLMAKNNVDVLLWRLNRVQYKDGNYIDYIYETVNNECRVKEIKYTGNNLVSPNLLPYNSILFEYQSRDINDKYKNITYEVDSPISLNSLLTKIVINADGLRFKSYSLKYANNNVNIFLNEIIETGSDDISNLNSTIFKYGDQPVVISDVNVGFSNSNGNDLITGDFNGDGYTDMATANRFIENGKVYHTSFSLYTKQTANNNLFNFKYTKTLPYFGEIDEKKSSYNVLSSDFNGDGRDDIAYLLTNKFRCDNTWVINDIFFKEMKIYLNNSDASSASELTITLPTPYATNYNGVYNANKYFTIGDYNGDGIMDVFLIMVKRVNCLHINSNDLSTKGFIWYGNSGNSMFTEVNITGISNFKFDQHSESWYTKNLNSIDFDGDGKQEIMITKGSLSEIFNVTNTSLSRLKLAGFPTEWHLMYFGDFNGDRKTDILTRAGLNNNGALWNVATSTGKEWIERPFSEGWMFSIPDINNYVGDKILISDFNGDGKSDIIHNFNLSGSSVVIYRSTGRSFTASASFTTSTAHSSINVIGDFNGDGRSDFINRASVTSSSYIVYMHSNGQELLLQRVKNGEGHITNFNYVKMCEPGTHYTKNTSNYPFYSLSLPMYLVTRLDKEGLVETTYNYHDAILHRKGKGFLGFRRVTESGPVNGSSLREGGQGLRAYTGPVRYNHKQHNYFNLDQSNASLLLDSIVNVRGNERINKKTITNQQIQQNTGNLEKIIWYRTPVVRDDNILENTLTDATNTLYDTDGNVTNSLLIQYSKSGTTLIEVERITTVTEFSMFGSFRKNVPTLITNTKKRAGQVDFTSVVKQTFTSIGQLQSKIDFFTQPKAITTTYSYNNLGNLAGLTVSATGLTSRSTINTYDPKGRYIESSTNAAGQVSSATYDSRWAKPLTSIGVDGIKSKFEYDVFGRLLKTYYRKDLTDEFSTTVGYFWGPYGTSYYILGSHPGKPDVKTYYDNLGRKVIQETEGYQGHWIKETFQYDGSGNLIFHNGPHRPSAGESSGLNTSTLYDDYGRLKTIINSLQTIEYSYDYTNGNKKVTQTLDLPVGQTDQITSKTTDITGKVITSTDASGTLDFIYYSHGNLRNIKRGAVTYSSMLYDDYGRQTQLNDVNSGITTYEYNAYGELFKENQPSNNNLIYTYNTLGNITSRTGIEGTTSYLYYTSGVKINKLDKITSFTTGYEEVYTYDNTYAKLTSKAEKINTVQYSTAYTYNKYDDLLTTTYPSGIIITNEYDANGYVTNIKNGTTTLFTNQGMTAYSNYKTYQYGNGLITDVSYNFVYPTRYYSRNSTATIKRQDLNLVWNYGTGNLTSRNDAIVNKSESFVYDIMNRLTSAQVGTNTALTSNYSTDGNITVKSDAAGIGGLEYLGSKINAISKISNPINISLNTQNIIYSVYQRPTNINESTKSLDLTYSFDYERRMATFKTNNIVDETRIYAGNYEKQTIGSTTREIHYVSNGESLIAIIIKEGTTTTNYYAHTDHLGSILSITDNSMNYVAQQNFDPWGRKRNHTTWTYISVAAVPTWLYRGFTGHESYDQFSLINMNARLYDPITGRMLSPDIMVNMPYSSQGYNRYSYANNNPLKYTDPDGNEIISAILIGAAIGLATNGISNLIQEKNFFDGWLKAAVIGGITGAISSGIGFLSTGSDKIVSELAKGSLADRAIFQGLMHGWSGAVMTVLQGGNPGRGFVSGLSSSLTASTVQNLGGGKISTVIGGSLSGGVGAAVVGGDFYQGAVFGLIASSLNHVAHEVVNSTSVEYSTENAHKVYKEIYGDIPAYTEITADGTAPSSYTKDGITVSDGYVYNNGVEVMATGITDDLGGGRTKIYLFRAAFTNKNYLINALGHEMFHANLLFAGISGASRHHASISLWLVSLNDKYPTFHGFGYSSMRSHLEFKSKGYFIESDLKYAPIFKK